MCVYVLWVWMDKLVLSRVPPSPFPHSVSICSILALQSSLGINISHPYHQLSHALRYQLVSLPRDSTVAALIHFPLLPISCSFPFSFPVSVSILTYLLIILSPNLPRSIPIIKISHHTFKQKPFHISMYSRNEFTD